MSQHLKPWVVERIVQFFNQIKTSSEITQTVKDHPNKGTATEKSAYGIGATVAERIMNYRQTLPAQRFRQIEQILGVQGMGEDKLHDLIFTFDIPAADVFKQSMDGKILYDNWLLHNYSTVLEAAEFEAVVSDEARFRDFVKNQVVAIAVSKYNITPTAEQLRPIAENYIETYQNPHYESFAFALWFYRFDADNWFSFQAVQEATERYLSIYQEHQHRLELYLFKGFKNARMLAQAITVEDLPVVVNYAERVITIWTGQLND